MNNKKHQATLYALKVSFPGDKWAQQIYRLSRKYLKSPILDVGAGSGALVEVLRRNCFDVHGIDLNPKNECDVFNPSRVEYGDITALKWGQGAFKTVFADDVLEHLTDEELSLALREVYRVLTTGGHFIITMPCDERLELRHTVCPTCGKVFHPIGHLQSFNKERLSKLLEDNGFEVKKFSEQVLKIASRLRRIGRFMTGWPFNGIMKRLGFETSIYAVAIKK